MGKKKEGVAKLTQMEIFTMGDGKMTKDMGMD